MQETPFLNEDQILSFKKNGHLVLPGFIDPAITNNWRTQFWNELGCSPDHPENWPHQGGVFTPDPGLGDIDNLRTIADQLGGTCFSGGGCGVKVRWPDNKAQWSMPETGHLDGYPGDGCQAVLMLGATTYLYDVGPRGGAFVYWPRSHHVAHRYFLQYPEHIEGTFRETPEWEARSWGMFTDQAPAPPREFTARAGDLILWHGWLCHTGSNNTGTMPRVGFFSRWTHVDDAGVRKNISNNMWHHWKV